MVASFIPTLYDEERNSCDGAAHMKIAETQDNETSLTFMRHLSMDTMTFYPRQRIRAGRRPEKHASRRLALSLPARVHWTRTRLRVPVAESGMMCQRFAVSGLSRQQPALEGGIRRSLEGLFGTVVRWLASVQVRIPAPHPHSGLKHVEESFAKRTA